MNTIETLTNERAAALENLETATRQYGASGTAADWKRVQAAEDMVRQLDIRITAEQEQHAQAAEQAEQDRVTSLQTAIEQGRNAQATLLNDGAQRQAYVAELVRQIQEQLTLEDDDRRLFNTISGNTAGLYAQLGISAACERPILNLPGTVQPSVIVPMYPTTLATQALAPLKAAVK